jgi:TIR domain
MKKYILGKVFISHSSKDKPFVRRLAQRLWREGYQVWLDEKELVPGDALATRLSDALKEARVVIVVVTPASRRSKWLAFELNKATERMVKGKCRVIPVLNGRVALPAELEGVVYADFRQSPRKGMASLLAALEAEADQALRGSWLELDAMIEESFDSSGSASRLGGYESIDYTFVTLNCLKRPGREQLIRGEEIVYDTVLDYGSRGEPIDEEWWSEYCDVQDRYGEVFHLVVSERPIAISDLQQSCDFDRVSYFVKGVGGHFPFCVVVAELHGIQGAKEKRTVIEQAREQIILLAKQMGWWLDAPDLRAKTKNRRGPRRKRA